MFVHLSPVIRRLLLNMQWDWSWHWDEKTPLLSSSFSTNPYYFPPVIWQNVWARRDFGLVGEVLSLDHHFGRAGFCTTGLMCKSIIFSNPVVLLVLVFFSEPFEDQFSDWGNVYNSLLLCASPPLKLYLNKLEKIWFWVQFWFLAGLLVTERLWSSVTRWIILSEVGLFGIKCLWAICSYTLTEIVRQEGLLDC